MRIVEIYADGFRNLTEVSIKFNRRTNILFGANGQGKTNILEAIWLCTGERSFRGAKEKDFFTNEQEFGTNKINESRQYGGYRIVLKYETAQREQTIEISSAKPPFDKRVIKQNGVTLKNMSEIYGDFKCVIFNPDDLDISKGSPEKRRGFLDIMLCQIEPHYKEMLDKYKKTLEQRNNQLKLTAEGKLSVDDLDIWDKQISQYGAYLTATRVRYVKDIKNYAVWFFGELSRGKEQLDMKYISTVFENVEQRESFGGQSSLDYYNFIKDKRESDIAAGFTQYGVHRDDVNFYINSLSAKEFASQGQHRSIVISLKLAQARIFEKKSGEAPCILLDDVLSELDARRRAYIMSSIRNLQVVITACEAVKSGEDYFNGRLVMIDRGSAMALTKR
ncbi:MAG: DNA replication/repair protein RecF [Ruminococcus sp.]|nr:DNA replication/repair protein RecF [Ruminococcus sp.]